MNETRRFQAIGLQASRVEKPGACTLWGQLDSTCVPGALWANSQKNNPTVGLHAQVDPRGAGVARDVTLFLHGDADGLVRRRRHLAEVVPAGGAAGVLGAAGVVEEPVL